MFGYQNDVSDEQNFNIFNQQMLAGAQTSAEVTIQQTHPSIENVTLSGRTNNAQKLIQTMSKPEIL